MSITLEEYKEAVQRYKITENSLYVLFSDMGDTAQDVGFQIAQGFVLADKGERGIEQIHRHNPSMIGCASLPTILETQQELQKTLIFEAQKPKLGGLLKPNTFLVLFSPQENAKVFLRGVRVKAFTSQKALDFVQKKFPDQIPLISGTEQDFNEMIAVMSQIVQEQKFSDIDWDYSQIVPGIPQHCLLSTKQQPEHVENDYFVAQNIEETI